MSAEFGPLLKGFRERRNVSQSKLAERAQLDHSYVSRLESGVRTPTRDAVDRLAAALMVGPEDRDALLRAAGFAGDGGTIDLRAFKSWLDEGIALLARSEGS